MLFRAAKILISCDSDIHIKDNLKDINITSSSSLADNSQSQQLLEFDQAASDSPVTSHNASYWRRCQGTNRILVPTQKGSVLRYSSSVQAAEFRGLHSTAHRHS